MNTIKTYIFKNFVQFALLFLVTVASLFLLMIRLKLTHSFFMLFLVWNLFLAAIPLLIAFIVEAFKLKRIGLFLLLGIWLLFLPNAPYIITDFIHLRHSQGIVQLFDFLVIGSFALSGIICYTMSMSKVLTLVGEWVSPKMLRVFEITIPLLCGFGIYLGRVLRWNSWDIISNPFKLMMAILDIFVNPFENLLAWGYFLFFGVFLYSLKYLWELHNKRLLIS